MTCDNPRIKIYFVTYNEHEALEQTLTSFFDTCDYNKLEEINIINNHSEFNIPDYFVDKVNVYHNVLRPDFSTGHLARNWNQAIVNGFKDLKSPDCDILVTCQNDVIFQPNWLERVQEIHEDYDFFCVGGGDCFCSYTPAAIEKVGIWDERYCGIGYQEADYLLRSVFHNPVKSSINAQMHHRSFNCLPDMISYQENSVCARNRSISQIYHHHSVSIAVGHSPSVKVFESKFDVNGKGKEITPERWGKYILGLHESNESIYSGKLLTSMLYPYFERDIPNRERKNYMN